MEEGTLQPLQSLKQIPGLHPTVDFPSLKDSISPKNCSILLCMTLNHCTEVVLIYMADNDIMLLHDFHPLNSISIVFLLLLWQALEQLIPIVLILSLLSKTFPICDVSLHDLPDYVVLLHSLT